MQSTHKKTTEVLGQLLLSHLQEYCSSPAQDHAIDALEQMLLDLRTDRR